MVITCRLSWLNQLSLDFDNKFYHQILYPSRIWMPGLTVTFAVIKRKVCNVSCFIFQVIDFTFTSFALELHSSCGWDRLLVYDGATTDDPLLGTFCGEDLPRPIVTSFNTATLVFVTDSSTNESGFSVEYTAVDPIMTSPSGVEPTIGPYESKWISRWLGAKTIDLIFCSKMILFNISMLKTILWLIARAIPLKMYWAPFTSSV